LVISLALIQYTVGLANYLHWTIQFAASRRLPGFATMLGVYRDPALLWPAFVFAIGIALLLIPGTARRIKARWIAATLISLPFLSSLAALYLQDNASDRVEALLRLWPVLLIASLTLALRQLRRGTTVEKLIPFVLLGTTHGAFLSQQLWGSTYALWPLLIILIGSIVASLASQDCSKLTNPTELRSGDPEPSTLPIVAFAMLAAITLLATGSYYALSHERLEYVDLSGDRLRRSSIPALRGLAMRGDWLPDFEELVAYSEREIPRTDAILQVPGEDLFYFTTGRTSQFPVILMDNTVNPYNASQIIELVRERNVRWIVVKRKLQLQEQPLAFRPQLLELLSHDFLQVESLKNYEVYRKRD
jgi:hypothetical protein